MRKKLWWALGASAVVAGLVVLLVRIIHHPDPARAGQPPLPPPGTSFAAPEEPIPSVFQACFRSDQVAPAGSPLRSGQVGEASRAFASAGSYRACLSRISMFQGASWGTFEYVRPDRRRWRIRYNGRQDSDPSGALEVVRIGADTWLRTDGDWTRLPAGRKLQDAVPSGAWLPDLAVVVKGFFEGVPLSSFTPVGSATARSGPCDVWAKAARPQGPSFDEAVCVGWQDGLPYRINAGGPSVEAYLQIEWYHYGAPVEIRPPH